MKGIISAGGRGTRLYPLTKVMSKQLQPIYDKPMIFYPLSILMLLGIKEILIISTPEDSPHIQKLLGDGSELGMKLSYEIQDRPNGIAEAYKIGEAFLAGEHSIMILGDNLFYGNLSSFVSAIEKQTNNLDQFNARIFAYKVNDPERFGVVEFDPRTKKVLSLEEKPSKPKSFYAVPGLYIYDGSVCEKVKSMKPSERGELEITDLNLLYLKEGKLSCEEIGRGMAWLDSGTPESLLEAGNFVEIIEKRQGLKIACIEEIALRKGFISFSEFNQLINSRPKGPYRDYLESIKDEFFKVSKNIKKAS